ncbi:hypothetical protein D3C76_1433910 [compost metagenome]
MISLSVPANRRLQELKITLTTEVMSGPLVAGQVPSDILLSGPEISLATGNIFDFISLR